jgi:hypothetical protein
VRVTGARWGACRCNPSIDRRGVTGDPKSPPNVRCCHVHVMPLPMAGSVRPRCRDTDGLDRWWWNPSGASLANNASLPPFNAVHAHPSDRKTSYATEHVDEKAGSAVTPAHRAVAVEQQEKKHIRNGGLLAVAVGSGSMFNIIGGDDETTGFHALRFGTTALTWGHKAHRLWVTGKCSPLRFFHPSIRAGSPGELNLEAKPTFPRRKGKREKGNQSHRKAWINPREDISSRVQSQAQRYFSYLKF